MFREDGKILHFSYPRCQASIASHVFVVEGRGVVKDMGELLPGIIHQMDAETLSQLTRLAQQTMGAGGASEGIPEEDEDEIPDLVESFDQEDTAAASS